MRKRQQLLGVLVSLHGWHPDQANTLIDDFAHELAEKQRAHGNAEDGEPGCWHDGVTTAADLIDPKAQRASTEGDTP